MLESNGWSLRSQETAEECSRWTTHNSPKGPCARVGRCVGHPIQHRAAPERIDTVHPSSFPTLLHRLSHLSIKLTSSLKTSKLTGEVFISTNKISKSG